MRVHLWRFFTVLVAVSIAIIHIRFVNQNRGTRTSFCYACCQAANTKKKLLMVVHLCKRNSSRLHNIAAHYEGTKACRIAYCAVCRAGRTPLNWPQRHVCGGICIPQVHSDVGKVPWNKYALPAREKAVEFINVLLTKHPGNTIQYMLDRRSREGMYRVGYCPCVLSVTYILHARLDYKHLIFHFLNYTLGVKIWSVSGNIGLAERQISRNMDRSRISGIGKLHYDSHVLCNNKQYTNHCHCLKWRTISWLTVAKCNLWHTIFSIGTCSNMAVVVIEQGKQFNIKITHF